MNREGDTKNPFPPDAWLVIAGEPVALGPGWQPCRGAHPGTRAPQPRGPCIELGLACARRTSPSSLPVASCRFREALWLVSAQSGISLGLTSQ